MKSIRQDLSSRLCLLAAVLLPVVGLAMYGTVRGLLLSQMDTQLQAKAKALIQAAEIDDGQLEMDDEIVGFAGFDRADREMFAVTDAQGALLARSAGRETSRGLVAAVGEKGISAGGNVELQSGFHWRVWRQVFRPKGFDGEPFIVLVAADARELQRTLIVLMLVLIGGGVGALFLGLIMLRWSLAKGLRPLDDMAQQVAGIRVGENEQRMEMQALPEELQGIAAKLNELIERAEVSLMRERRFSSHAAHELRTPMAELRAMAELVQTWPDERTPERSAEMVEVVGEMEVLLDKLTLLARADAGAQPMNWQVVELEPLVYGACERLKDEAERRGVRWRIEVEGKELKVRTDEVLFGAILSNLLGNAVSHARVGSEVRVEATEQMLRVSNEAPQLKEEDVPMLFERFWRKSSSRSSGSHSGLGLSIVMACAELLEAKCVASLSAEKWLMVEVRWV